MIRPFRNNHQRKARQHLGRNLLLAGQRVVFVDRQLQLSGKDFLGITIVVASFILDAKEQIQLRVAQHSNAVDGCDLKDFQLNIWMFFIEIRDDLAKEKGSHNRRHSQTEDRLSALR